MYVPGKMRHGEKVLVDIGTGYYVEKVQNILLSCSLGTRVRGKGEWEGGGQRGEGRGRSGRGKGRGRGEGEGEGRGKRGEEEARGRRRNGIEGMGRRKEGRREREKGEGKRKGRRWRKKGTGMGKGGGQNHVTGVFSRTQTVEEAGKFFQRRMDHVTKNLETLQKGLMEKCKMREGTYLIQVKAVQQLFSLAGTLPLTSTEQEKLA